MTAKTTSSFALPATCPTTAPPPSASSRGEVPATSAIEVLIGKISFKIVSEDGRLVWKMSMGSESYRRFKLDSGVYHIKATDGGNDGSTTLRFVDVSLER